MGITNKQAAKYMAQRLDVANDKATFSGCVVPRNTSQDFNGGWIHSDFPIWARDSLNNGTARKGAYIVFSWNTPIAWIWDGTDNWIIPNVRYSQSTARQLSLLIGEIGMGIPNWDNKTTLY